MEQDPLNYLFDDQSRNLIYGLVDRKDPAGRAGDKDDLFQPTLSSVCKLFNELLQTSTPALYENEWEAIVTTFEKRQRPFRLPPDCEYAKCTIVLSLEDTADRFAIELSKKIGGFSDLEICSIFLEVQKHLVAKNRGLVREFPKIPMRV